MSNPSADGGGGGGGSGGWGEAKFKSWKPPRISIPEVELIYTPFVYGSSHVLLSPTTGIVGFPRANYDSSVASQLRPINTSPLQENSSPEDIQKIVLESGNTSMPSISRSNDAERPEEKTDRLCLQSGGTLENTTPHSLPET